MRDSSSESSSGCSSVSGGRECWCVHKLKADSRANSNWNKGRASLCGLPSLPSLYESPCLLLSLCPSYISRPCISSKMPPPVTTPAKFLFLRCRSLSLTARSSWLPLVPAALLNFQYRLVQPCTQQYEGSRECVDTPPQDLQP